MSVLTDASDSFASHFPTYMLTKVPFWTNSLVFTPKSVIDFFFYVWVCVLFEGGTKPSLTITPVM